MRYIDRKKIPVPTIFGSETVSIFNDSIKSFLKDNITFSKAPKPNGDILADIKPNLYKLFNGKCSYCECKLQSGDSAIDHFRPIGGAERFKGEVDRRYYSWLALDWDNLYLVCKECNIYKRNLFPVKETGKIGAKISTLRIDEDAFLLDPCYDKPEKHINVNLDGRFIAATDKGNITIDILNLNRADLVDKRKEKILSFQHVWESLFSLDVRDINYTIEDFQLLLKDDAEFSGTIYLLLKQIARYFGFPKKLHSDTNQIKLRRILKYYKIRNESNLEFINQNVVNGNIFDDINTINKSYYLQSVYIKNFKGIKEFELDFPFTFNNGNNGLCKAIIGKNTIGKTTILQAIALGILGHKNAYRSGFTPQDCLSDTNNEGSIEVRFYGESNINSIRFNKNSDQFDGSTSIETLLLGYGAYRFPARKMLGKIKRDNNYRVLSLFDERELINGPLGLFKKYYERKNDIATSIQTLLKHDNVNVRIIDEFLEIEHNGHSLKLEKFSSGYKSIISFVTDIMDVLYTNTTSMQAASGIVLVDEIDAHLHPEWRLRIVSSLRELFPNVQFIFTTHDPLILRGLSYDEVTILEKDNDGRIDVIKSAPDVMSGLGIDQMLTAIFGLETTMNSDIENNLAMYYSLLSLGEQNLSTKQTNQLNNLKRQLDNYNVLGNTKRERLMYKLIDVELSKMKDETFDEWSEDSVSKLTSKLSEKLRLVDND